MPIFSNKFTFYESLPIINTKQHFCQTINILLYPLTYVKPRRDKLQL